MKALVTGGAGFIGSNLVDALLARGQDVVVVDDLSTGFASNLPRGVPLVERDVREPLVDVFLEHRPALCFHLAACVNVAASVERPDLDARVNVVGTVNVLAAAAKVDAKVVFTSSGGAIYGEAPTPVGEAGLLQPVSPYGCAKLAAEAYVETYGRLEGAGHAIMRFANVYGPRQVPKSEAAVVGAFMTTFARGATPRIFGDGLQTRDFVYVGDALDAMLRAADSAGTFNVGSGVKTTVLDLYERCAQIAGAHAEPEFAEARHGELRDNVLDCSYARQVLGWRPTTSLDEGLVQTWRWAIEHVQANAA